MGHHHHHHHNQNLKVAFFLNLSFTIIEIIGGILTNSMAIFSDALHDLGDTLGIGLSIYFEKISEKGSDKHYSYGYRRFSVISALINSMILLLGSAFIVYESIPRILEPQQVDAEGMLYLAILGVSVNGIAVWKIKKGNKGNSINQRAIMLHLMEDVLGWVAVLLGSIVMYFWDFPIIDPILSLLISIYILWNVAKNIKQVANIILQAIPKNINIDKLKEQITGLNNVSSLHDLHFWSMDGEYNIASMHVVVLSNTTQNDVVELKKIIRNISKRHNIEHPTIEIEYQDEECNLCN